MKRRVIAIVDGFNLYHSMADDSTLKQYKWLNLKKLVGHFLSSNDELKTIFYFSALAYWDPKKVNRHKEYIRALRSVEIEPVLSEFKMKSIKCRECHKFFKRPEEKQTDVQIAIKLFEGAIDDIYDKVFIVSGDTDLIPAIKVVRKKFPSKTLHFLFPPGRSFESLKMADAAYSRIKEKHLKLAQFPDEITLNDHERIVKPKEWK